MGFAWLVDYGSENIGDNRSIASSGVFRTVAILPTLSAKSLPRAVPMMAKAVRSR